MEQQYKYYYTYKITCTEGSFKDKIYYGQHKTNDLNDGYKGSGKKLLDYYKKYPTSYTMEIIQFYSNLDELNKAEYELIEPHLGKDYCLNLRDGGNQGKCSEELRLQISNTLKGIIPWNKGVKQTEEARRKNSEGHKGLYDGSNNPKAKKCTINGKTYGCIKDAWRDICPEICYQAFRKRTKNNYYNK